MKNAVTIACLFCALLLGCQNDGADSKDDKESPIIGLWQPEDEMGVWVEFDASQKFVVGRYDKETVSGTWELTKDSLILKNEEGERTAIRIVTIKDDIIEYHDNGRVMSMKRLESIPELAEDESDDSEETDDLEGKITFTDELHYDVLPYLVDGDTLDFDGTIKGPIKLENMSDITLLGNYSTFLYHPDEYEILIELVNCQNITIDGFFITHHPVQDECQDGVIVIRDCYNVNITNNDISGSGLFGVSIQGSEEVNVTNNIIHNCSGEGIFIGENPYPPVIEDNIFYNNGYLSSNDIYHDPSGKTDYSYHNNTFKNIKPKHVFVTNTTGLPFYDHNDSLLYTIPFKSKLKVAASNFDEDRNYESVFEEGVGGSKLYVVYNNIEGWVNDSYTSTLPIPNGTYSDFGSYLNDVCSPPESYDLPGHTDGEAYMDITIQYYDEGCYVIHDGGWEWGSSYYKVYNMTANQLFFLCKLVLEKYELAYFPDDQDEGLLDSTETEEGTVFTRFYSSSYDGQMWHYNVSIESDMWGESYEVTQFNGTDGIVIESHGM